METKLSRKVAWSGLEVILLNNGNLMKETNQFLYNDIFLIKQKVLNGMEEDGICKNGSIE